MPCMDYPTRSELEDEAKERARVVAALCAVLTQLENTATSSDSLERFYNGIDWKEAGITKSWLQKWWEKHRELDEERRIIEAKERARKERIKHLREKMNLTDEEWRLLREDLKRNG